MPGCVCSILFTILSNIVLPLFYFRFDISILLPTFLLLCSDIEVIIRLTSSGFNLNSLVFEHIVLN